MKLFAIISILLFWASLSSAAYCQEKNILLIENSTCDCLDKIKPYRNIGYADLKNCMGNAIAAHYELILKSMEPSFIDTASDSELYKRANKIGQEIGRKLDTSMVYACDIYFKTIDSLRFEYLSKINKDSVIKELEKLSLNISTQKNDHLEQKAKLTFLKGNYEEALNLSENLLAEDGNNVWGLIIKSTILEVNKKYAEAIQLYYKLSRITHQNNYLVWAIAAKKKMDLAKSQ